MSRHRVAILVIGEDEMHDDECAARSGTPCDCAVTTIRRALANAGQEQAADEPHAYTSTYCLHGQHTNCRLTCKVCNAPCRCNCHETGAAWSDDQSPD